MAVVRRRSAVIEDPRGELLAMREPNRMCAAQRHHFLNGKSSGAENSDDLRHRHGGSGERAFNGGGSGYLAVFPAEEDGVIGTADHGDEVPSCGGEDVGAGDGVGAGELEGGLGPDDEVEGVAGEGEVDVGVALGGVEGGGGDEDGGVAAVGEAVVEEEAERGGGGGGGGDLLVGNGVADDLGERRAGSPVIVGGERGGGGMKERREEKEKEKRHGDGDW